MKLLVAILLVFFAQSIVWFQFWAPSTIQWFKDNTWFTYAAALPVTYLFFKSSQLSIEYFGEYWPSRLLGFGVGIISFTMLTMYFTGEGINFKTLITLILAIAIVLLQTL